MPWRLTRRLDQGQHLPTRPSLPLQPASIMHQTLPRMATRVKIALRQADKAEIALKATHTSTCGTKRGVGCCNMGCCGGHMAWGDGGTRSLPACISEAMYCSALAAAACSAAFLVRASAVNTVCVALPSRRGGSDGIASRQVKLGSAGGGGPPCTVKLGMPPRTCGQEELVGACTFGAQIAIMQGDAASACSLPGRTRAELTLVSCRRMTAYRRAALLAKLAGLLQSRMPLSSRGKPHASVLRTAHLSAQHAQCSPCSRLGDFLDEESTFLGCSYSKLVPGWQACRRKLIQGSIARRMQPQGRQRSNRKQDSGKLTSLAVAVSGFLKIFRDATLGRLTSA